MHSKNMWVGKAILYGLVGPGINSGGARISVSFQIGPGAYLASRTLSTESFLGVNLPVRGVDHPLHLAQKLKKE